MPAVATPSAEEAGIDTDQDWPIQTDFARARVRRSPMDGTLTVTRPERRVTADDHPEASWASMWRTQNLQWYGLTEEEALGLAEELDRHARRRYQLDRLEEAIARQRSRDQEMRRQEAAADLRQFIKQECAGLLDMYRDVRPRRYEGGDDGGWTLVPFSEWAKSQLTPEEAERVAEREEELRQAYDLPGYVQLL
jgi:hypothetical protein